MVNCDKLVFKYWQFILMLSEVLAYKLELLFHDVIMDEVTQLLSQLLHLYALANYQFYTKNSW